MLPEAAAEHSGQQSQCQTDGLQMKRMAASFCLRPKWHVQTSKPWLYKTPHFNTPLCCTSFVQDMSEMRGLFVYGRAFSMDAAAAFTEGDAQISSDSARRHHCNAFHGGQRREFGLPLRQGCDPERHKNIAPMSRPYSIPFSPCSAAKTSPAGSIANETATVERGKSRCGGISTLQQTAATSPNRMNADARPLTIPARACAARRGAPRSALILRFA